jgi:hypothetical protein
MPHQKSPIHLIVTIMYVVLAVLTVIPREAASTEVQQVAGTTSGENHMDVRGEAS